jgi:hypothetical protein
LNESGEGVSTTNSSPEIEAKKRRTLPESEVQCQTNNIDIENYNFGIVVG